MSDDWADYDGPQQDVEDYAELESGVARLWGLFEKYAEHQSWRCADACVCGLDELLKKRPQP